MEDVDTRQWTLEGARAVMKDVRERTERAVKRAESLVEARERAPKAEQAELDQRIQGVVSRWAREIEALGAEVKGVWLVDFDNGSGYYCWKWPEPELAFFHTYEEGFEGRVRIQ